MLILGSSLASWTLSATPTSGGTSSFSWHSSSGITAALFGPHSGWCIETVMIQVRQLLLKNQLRIRLTPTSGPTPAARPPLRRTLSTACACGRSSDIHITLISHIHWCNVNLSTFKLSLSLDPLFVKLSKILWGSLHIYKVYEYMKCLRRSRRSQFTVCTGWLQ